MTNSRPSGGLVAEDSGVSQTFWQLAAYPDFPFQFIRVEDSGGRLELLSRNDVDVVFTNVNALQMTGVEAASAECSTNNRALIAPRLRPASAAGLQVPQASKAHDDHSFAFTDAEVVGIYVCGRLTSLCRHLIIDDSSAQSKLTCEGLAEVLPNGNISGLGKLETLPPVTNKRTGIAMTMAERDDDRRRQTFECDTAALL